MNTAILAAIITALPAVTVAVINAIGSRKSIKAADLAAFRGNIEAMLGKMEENQEDVKTDLKLAIHRIGELEKKQDKFNGWVERIVATEQSAKSAHHRLDRMEGKGNG